MKITYSNKGYFAGGAKWKFDKKFDYLLFRQDFNGAQSVYFNEKEIDRVLELIGCGDILIHPNYSFLFAKNAKKLSKLDLGCYKDVWKEENRG